MSRSSHMALLLRVRQAFVRSSSIPKYCSFPHGASDSSHLINLSKTLLPAASRQENSRFLPNPSKHNRPPPSTFLNRRFSFRQYFRQPETKIQKDEIDFVKFPKPSPKEMIETCFQTPPTVLGSVEDAKGIHEEISDKFKKSGVEMIEQLKCACIREKRSVEDSQVIEEISDKLKKSGLEVIEQLKDMLGFVLVSPDLDIECKDTRFEGDKCENEVITPRLPSPLTEYENQLSVEGMEMIDEMSEKLTKHIEVLEKLKAMHGFTWHSCDFYIDCKKKKSEDYIEKAKKTACMPRKCCLFKVILAYWHVLSRFKDYIEITTHMPEKSLLNTFLPVEISMFAAAVARLKDIHGPTWRSHFSNFDEFEEDIDEDLGIERVDVYTYVVEMEDATEQNTTPTTCLDARQRIGPDPISDLCL